MESLFLRYATDFPCPLPTCTCTLQERFIFLHETLKPFVNVEVGNELALETGKGSTAFAMYLVVKSGLYLTQNIGFLLSFAFNLLFGITFEMKCSLKQMCSVGNNIVRRTIALSESIFK